MKRVASFALICGLIAIGAGSVMASRDAAAAKRSQSAAAVARVRDDRRVLDANIVLYEDAARIDTLSATFPAQAAALYLQRARITASDDDVQRAEAAARRSLALRTSHNDDAAVTLVGALLAQHRFVDARDVATALVQREPGAPSYRAMLGEILLELGEYDAARTVFLALDSERTRPGVASRYARFMELTGRVAESRALIRTAGEQMLSRDDLPRADIAWYFLRMGDLELREGRARRAKRAYHDGLDVAPGDHRLLGALARLEAAQGHFTLARALGEEALGTAFDPAILALLSEVAIAEGDTSQQREYRRAMELVVPARNAPPHRAWSLTLVDHGQRTSEILAIARKDLETRRDVYGYDLLAWALYRTGRYAEAREAIAMAVAQGTQDALIHFHAGMIHRANADDALAQRHLTRALALNRFFGISQPAEARAVLDSIDRGAR